MSQDYYKFIISPETIKGDIFTVQYDGESFGVYSAMTEVVDSGPDNSSLLTGLTVNILLRQSCVDSGYYSPFDGAILQKDVVCNFIFSSTTESPYEYYIYNTSDQTQKFLELSSYTLDWGDGTPLEIITNFSPNSVSHLYPEDNKKYKITLKQTNPWGVTKIEKTIATPFSQVEIFNPKGEAFFVPKGGNWSDTPVSYDYIFSGDAENNVDDQTSDKYTTVPFIVSGLTKSRITELSFYGNPKYRPNVPVIKNNQIWGIIDEITDTFSAYTINEVNYIDFINGLTIFYENSSGLTQNNITSEPITKEEVLIKSVDQPQIQSNVFVERGKVSAYEKIQRIGEVDNLGDLINYGYGFFVVENKD